MSGETSTTTVSNRPQGAGTVSFVDYHASWSSLATTKPDPAKPAKAKATPTPTAVPPKAKVTKRLTSERYDTRNCILYIPSRRGSNLRELDSKTHMVWVVQVMVSRRVHGWGTTSA